MKRPELIPNWLAWARELQSLAQYGLRYATDVYERKRYERIREIAAEIVSSNGNFDPSAVTELLEGEEGDPTPKVDVRGVVFQEDAILLVQEKSDNGRWTLPGGWADVGESPTEAVEREVLEESGFRVKANKLLSLYDRDRQGHPPGLFHIYKLFFLCEILGGGASDSIETEGAAFFREKEIPELSVARVTAKQIKNFFDHLRNPDRQTDID